MVFFCFLFIVVCLSGITFGICKTMVDYRRTRLALSRRIKHLQNKLVAEGIIDYVIADANNYVYFHPVGDECNHMTTSQLEGLLIPELKEGYLLGTSGIFYVIYDVSNNKCIKLLSHEIDSVVE